MSLSQTATTDLATSETSRTVTVQANQAWLATGVSIQSGMTLTISYQGGSWTADPDTNGGQQYDANGCPGLVVSDSHTSYPITGVNEGALVGRINPGGVPFLIGNDSFQLSVAAFGELELCINDDLTGDLGDGLADNTGSLNVLVTVPADDNPNTLPDLSQPLALDPAQTSPEVPLEQLGPLQYLLGTWTNKNLPGTEQGGPDSPYAYNVMPLPQVDPSTPSGYILKNSTYYEELTFTAIHGNAPNRGGTGQQVAYTLFYEQRVYFAEGPNKDALVHAENGSLLYIHDTKQPLGPYGNGDAPGLGMQTVQDSQPPSQAFNLVKQVAVPHGNSILALGNYADSTHQSSGVPAIPAQSPLPDGVDTTQYTELDTVSNPHPELTANPNQVLVNALEARPCTNYLHLSMSTANGKGAVTNIGFEQQHANVSQYVFNYWLEAFDNSNNYTQLQYTQMITLLIPINGDVVSFPHITANTLTKVSG